MGHRKWEDLPVDCLVKIFSRVGVVSLVYEVPYVCKSWHKAILSPLCWKSLIFPNDLPGPSLSGSLLRSSRNKYHRWRDHVHHNYMNTFAKFVIRRSCGSANLVAFHPYFVLTFEVLDSIGEGCPNLKCLVLPCDVKLNDISMLSSVMCKWKKLEALQITSDFSNWQYNDSDRVDCITLKEFILQISVHCKKFESLYVVDTEFGQSEAYLIANLLPNIKSLFFRDMWISRDDLVVILKGCEKLVNLDVGNSLSFEVDDEILKLATHIPTFKFGCMNDYGYGDVSYMEL